MREGDTRYNLSEINEIILSFIKEENETEGGGRERERDNLFEKGLK